MIIPYTKFPLKKGNAFRPIIEVEIILKLKTVKLLALIDTGADITMANKDIAKKLGFDFLFNKPTSTVTGVSGSKEPTWNQQVDLKISGFDEVFSSQVIFMKSNNFTMLLGHTGFLEFFDITFQTSRKQFEIEIASQQ